MTNEDIFKKEPVLIHNGEEAKLSEIISNKKVLSITINYLSKQRKVKLPGLKGALGFKKIVQDEKEITITDQKGIHCTWDKNELVTIRFENQDCFKKLDDGNYDESTLFRRYVMSPFKAYQFNFHVGNIAKIEWEQEIKHDEFESQEDFTSNHGYFPED